MWKVLVVDDNFVNRKLMIEILRGRANCDIAVNGFEAVEAYELSEKNKTPYDLILLDIAMPEMDGLKVLGLIRESEAKKGTPLGGGVPIIVVTAHKRPFADSFKSGCDDYILKPIDVEMLLAKMENLINRRKQKRNKELPGGKDEKTAAGR